MLLQPRDGVGDKLEALEALSYSVFAGPLLCSSGEEERSLLIVVAGVTCPDFPVDLVDADTPVAGSEVTKDKLELAVILFVVVV